MLKLGLVIGILVSFLSESFGQDRYYTFYDDCILRTEPSVDSKMILSIPIKTQIHSFDGYNNIGKRDTINNEVGNWIWIEYKGHKGYLWQNLLSDNTFTTHYGELVLLNTTKKNVIEYKVFYRDSLMVEDQIEASFNFKQKAIVDGSPLIELKDQYLIYGQGTLDFFTFKNYKLVIEEIQNATLSSKGFVEGNPAKVGLVNGNHVNIRRFSNDSSQVLSKLNTNQIVSVDTTHGVSNLHQESNEWIKIKHHKKNGYVWNTFIETPYAVFIQPSTQLKFICFYHKLVVANHNNEWLDDIVLKNPVESERVKRLNHFNTTIHSSPFKSSNRNDVVLTIDYSDSEMDVGWRTTKQFLWNGNNLVKLYQTNEAEEMGYDHFESYTPMDRRINAIQDPVVKIEHTTTQFLEEYGDITNYLGKRNWEHNKRLNLYAYTLEGLRQVPSRIDFLEAELNKGGDNFKIQDYKGLDFNKDGLTDFIFAAKKIDPIGQNNDNLADEVYLGYAIAKSDTSFSLPQLNKTLLKWSHVNSIELKTNGFIVWSASWKKNEDEDGQRCSFMKVKFRFNISEDRFYIESKQMDGGQELFYKKNPILLERTW